MRWQVVTGRAPASAGTSIGAAAAVGPDRSRTRRWWLLPVLALTVVAGAGCLGPDTPDPTGTAPFGRLDGMVADGDGVRVLGWVADPDTANPIQVTVMSNQRAIYGAADRARPDVAAAVPGVGPYHGFDIRYPGLGRGVQQVCAWAENVGRGDQARVLGCSNVDLGVPPVGNLDVVTPGTPGRVQVAGWAYDPEWSGAVDVVARVDGAVAVRRAADRYRADVAAAFGRGGSGFAFDVAAAPGARTVCLAAVNVGSGTDQPLGCSVVQVEAPPLDRRPTGRVDGVDNVAGGIGLSGSATDADGPVARVLVAVDGGAPRSVPVVRGRFDAVVTGLAPGPHRACVTLVDVPAAGAAAVGDTTLPCSSVVVGTPSVASGGAPLWNTGVGPPPGHPLERVDRDAGVSTRLRDGSLLWFFADSSETDAAGNLRYFVNNTAAWSAPGSPLTRDAVGGGGRPVQFVDPGPGFPACPSGRSPAMWPLSAVTVPVGGLDRVLVFLGNVCLGGPMEISEVGVSVAEYWYDPGAPPVDVAVRGTVLNQVLFTSGEDDHGTAAVLGDDGMVYAYACRRPATATFMVPGAYGPCTVGRVAPADVAVRGSWRWWNGSGWATDKGTAADIGMPDGANGFSLPVASASVVRDQRFGAYVMAYSPWPGFTDRVEVRVASRPQGPWTAPVEVKLPACYDQVGGQEFLCYAATAQPAFSAPGLLGLGYYDQRLDPVSPRGQYRVAGVPFDVAGVS